MTIGEMIKLEERHGSGWRFADNTGDKSMADEVRFLNAFLGIRKELLDLWGAANLHTLDHENCGCGLCSALRKLGMKSASMDA